MIARRQVPRVFLISLSLNMMLLFYIIWIRKPVVNKTSILEHPSRLNRGFAQQLNLENFTPSQADIIQKAQDAAPTFPISFWEENKDKNLYYKNSSCAKFPNVYKLHVNNLYWQVLTTTEGTFYLFGAYYDLREHCSVCPAIRLIALINRVLVNHIKTYCQIWFADGNEPVIVESLAPYFQMFGGHVMHNPYLITCPIPQEFNHRIPICVSLVKKMCDVATNSLRIIFNKPSFPEEKKDFCVCVKLLDCLHQEKSTRFIEWVELLRLLGADKIVIYVQHVHENLMKVLKYYEKQGVLELVPTTLGGNQMNAAYFRGEERSIDKASNEIVQYNDCFYKNMYKYNYIAVLDIDEIIIPSSPREYDWKDLMHRILNMTSDMNVIAYETDMTSFSNCQNVTDSFEDIPPYMYMLQHIFYDIRYLAFSLKEWPKSIFDTGKVEAVNNHKVTKSLLGKINTYRINREDAELFHYRPVPYRWLPPVWPCDEIFQNNTVNTVMWKYKPALINQCLTTLYNLGFFY